MTVDVNIRQYDEKEIKEAIQVMDDSPVNDHMDVNALELETSSFEWGVETDDAEEFFDSISGASIRVGPRTGIGGGGDIGELYVDPDQEAYEHVDTVVDILEDHGYEIPQIRFSDGMSIQRLGKIGGGTEVEDVPDYVENFENGQHEIIITAEKDGERTAIKYNTDGYAVVEKGEMIHPEEREFLKPDRELGFELSEELRDSEVPIEWRNGPRQNLDYTEERVEYEDGTVSPEGEPAPLPTSVTGGNDYDTGQRSYQVGGEEFSGTVLEPRQEDKSYFQRLRDLV